MYYTPSQRRSVPIVTITGAPSMAAREDVVTEAVAARPHVSQSGNQMSFLLARTTTKAIAGQGRISCQPVRHVQQLYLCKVNASMPSRTRRLCTYNR